MNFAESNAHRKTNARGSFETYNFFFLIFSLMNIHCEAQKQHFETHFLSYIDVLWSKCICIGKVGLWNEHTHTHAPTMRIHQKTRTIGM